MDKLREAARELLTLLEEEWGYTEDSRLEAGLIDDDAKEPWACMDRLRDALAEPEEAE